MKKSIRVKFGKLNKALLFTSCALLVITAIFSVFAYIRGIEFNYELLAYLIAAFCLLPIIIALVYENKATEPRNALVTVMLTISCLFGIMSFAVTVVDYNRLGDSGALPSAQVSENNETQSYVHGACIPADTLTAVFTDMNATIMAETNFEAMRVTAQSIVDGVGDDIIELHRAGIYTWPAKVRFEIVGTHSVEICAYTQDGQCITDVLTVQYPFS